MEEDMIDEDTAHAVRYGQALERSRAVFAQSDYPLIKRALLFYAQHNGEVTESETSQLGHLLHRLERLDK
jgi:hypothetical protein